MTQYESIRSLHTLRPDAPGDGRAQVRASGEVVRVVDFRSKRRERIYDPEKIWSGEHTMLDYVEL
ncbi:hypothetical protein ACQR16_29425 [Bradyrhizobium oligotrophicum]|uniref:hypothetical protein n=1 Tax=Bradyrhizobium oligotrophicum TaxID=44255 RepID=UPI003EBB7E02